MEGLETPGRGAEGRLGGSWGPFAHGGAGKGERQNWLQGFQPRAEPLATI